MPYFPPPSVPSSRNVSTGTGLKGGGDLSADRTINQNLPSLNGFRLTSTSGAPIDTSTGTRSTIYLTPFKGNQISLYNGATWDTLSSAEVSISVTGRTTDLPFDIFAYNNSGTLTLELLDWTSATARATALVRQDGVWCKTGALTRRWVGSCRARSSTTFSWVPAGSNAAAKLDLFNADNRIAQPWSFVDTTNTWTYTTATWRQAEANAKNQVDIMVGLAEETLQANLVVSSTNSSANILRAVAVSAADSTSTPAGIRGYGITAFADIGSALPGSVSAYLSTTPAIGRHFYAWLEWSTASGTTTWFGDNGSTDIQSGMAGVWTC